MELQITPIRKGLFFSHYHQEVVCNQPAFRLAFSDWSRDRVVLGFETCDA